MSSAEIAIISLVVPHMLLSADVCLRWATWRAAASALS